MERLLRFNVPCAVEVPSIWGATARTMSGRLGDSTRKTSAPMSASIIVAKGPGTRVVKSKIFKFSRARIIRTFIELVSVAP